jgi:urease accessory protein UreE
MLRVFKPLPVASEVHSAAALPAAARDYAHDTVTLGWEERMKARALRRSDAGLEFGTSLPRGTILRHGDIFVLDVVATRVSVVERDEPVLVIEPSTTEEWARFAYHIGNSHQPMMVADERIVCPDVAGIAQVLEYHRIPFERARRTFTPIGHVPDHRHRES